MSKLNLYLGFTPVKRANPICLVMNLGVPLRLTERLLQRVWRLYHRLAKQRVSCLCGANMGAERVVFVVSYRSNDLIRVVTLYASVIASGLLTNLMGCVRACLQQIPTILTSIHISGV